MESGGGGGGSNNSRKKVKTVRTPKCPTSAESDPMLRIELATYPVARDNGSLSHDPQENPKGKLRRRTANHEATVPLVDGREVAFAKYKVVGVQWRWLEGAGACRSVVEAVAPLLLSVCCLGLGVGVGNSPLHLTCTHLVS